MLRRNGQDTAEDSGPQILKRHELDVLGDEVASLDSGGDGDNLGVGVGDRY